MFAEAIGRRGLAAGLILALCACATTERTHGVKPAGFLRDYSQLETGRSGQALLVYLNPSADFSQYNTYNFFTDAGPDSTSYRGLFTQYMVTAIDREMQKRGYSKSNAPDLLVNFNANFQDKTKQTNVPTKNQMLKMATITDCQ